MPIYEFQCTPCRTVFSFFARGVDTTTCPPCPRCGRPLSREVSAVAVLGGGGDGDEDGLGDVRIDESRMERAMDAMGSQLDSLGDSDDPRAAAAAMKSFSEASGLTSTATSATPSTAWPRARTPRPSAPTSTP